MAEINKIAQQRIEQAAREEAEELDLRGLGLHELPEEIRQLKKLGSGRKVSDG